MEKYYSFVTTDSRADIYIYGDIVTPDEKAWSELWGDNAPTSGLSLATDIADLNVDVIHVHINSYGGIVSEGLAIYNALKQHSAEIITYNDGFCCSAAVLPFLAGNKRIASSASVFLFHQVMISAYGNADDHRDIAEELDVLTQTTMKPYMSVANIGEDEMTAIFKSGKLLTPEYVNQIGIATGVETYDAANKASASARGAFFAQLFESSGRINALERQIETANSELESLKNPKPENMPTKFLNALTGGKV